MVRVRILIQFDHPLFPLSPSTSGVSLFVDTALARLCGSCPKHVPLASARSRRVGRLSVEARSTNAIARENLPLYE